MILTESKLRQLIREEVDNTRIVQRVYDTLNDAGFDPQMKRPNQIRLKNGAQLLFDFDGQDVNVQFNHTGVSKSYTFHKNHNIPSNVLDKINVWL
jgi:hypothetical protein